ncbi:MAG: glycosyltransferase family 4 protein [Chloroflexi bacterium]|nr:glycosyltransferase family 4 protein [Chloroflexota bacterium]
MRIGIDFASAAAQRAGIGRFTRELVKALLELDRGNEYVLVKTSDGEALDLSEFGHSNLSFRSLPVSHRWSIILWHRLGLPLPLDWLTGRLDLYHATDFVLPPLRCRKTVLTIHDLSFLVRPECAHPKVARFLSKAVPKSIRRATLIHANSENTKRDLMERLGVAPEKIEVVYEGVTPGYTRVTDEARLEQVRRKYRLDKPFVLSVGTLEPRKNHARLIEAHSALRERRLPQELLIAGGSGWLYEETLPLPGKLGLEDSVRFLGFVPDDDLPALMSLADVFAYPSLYEGFGLPVVEAMACGTPVVASNTSCLPEIAGDAALLVDPTDVSSLADALYRAATDDDLRRVMAKRGLARAARFTWRAAAGRMLILYRRLGEDSQVCVSA